MAQADIDENVKVVAICPGMVSTPLWTGEQGKHVNAQFSYNDDMCITSDEVAQAMVEMVVQGKYKGGALMECKKGALRQEVESRQAVILDGPPGPEMRGWFDRLYQPLREVFAKERGIGMKNGV